MHPIRSVVARSSVAIVVITLAVPWAGAVTREGGAPGLGGPRPRLVRILKKVVKSLGDLLSNPRP